MNLGAGKRIFFIAVVHFNTGMFLTTFNKRHVQSASMFTIHSNDNKSQQIKTYSTFIRYTPTEA